MKYKGKLKKIAASDGAQFAIEAASGSAGAFAGEMTNFAQDKIDWLQNNKWALPTGKVLLGFGGAYFGRNIPAVKEASKGFALSGVVDFGRMIRDKVNANNSGDPNTSPTVTGTIGKTITIDEDIMPIAEEINGPPVYSEALGATENSGADPTQTAMG